MWFYNVTIYTIITHINNFYTNERTITRTPRTKNALVLDKRRGALEIAVKFYFGQLVASRELNVEYNKILFSSRLDEHLDNFGDLMAFRNRETKPSELPLDPSIEHLEKQFTEQGGGPTAAYHPDNIDYLDFTPRQQY